MARGRGSSRRRSRRRPSWSCSRCSATGAVAVVVDTLAVVAAQGRRERACRCWCCSPSRRRCCPAASASLAFVLGAAGWLGLLLADGSDRVVAVGHAAAQRARQRRPTRASDGSAAASAAPRWASRSSSRSLVPGLDGRLLGGDGTGSGLGGSRTTTTYNPLLELAGQLAADGPGSRC